MSQDVKTLVLSLSREADRLLQQGDQPPICGAMIDAWGALQPVQPPPLHRYTPRRQIEHLEAYHRRAAREGLCRACAHLLEVNVHDPSGRDRVALLVSVETAAGTALDIFIPLSESGRIVGGGIDVDATFAKPRPPRVFLHRPPTTPTPDLTAHDSSPLSGPWDSRLETTATSHARMQTRLLAAIVRGDIEGLERACAQGARVDEPLLGQTPVEMALRAGKAEALDWLLTSGAPLPEISLARLRELDRPEKRPLLRVLEQRGLRIPLSYRALQGLVHHSRLALRRVTRPAISLPEYNMRYREHPLRDDPLEHHSGRSGSGFSPSPLRHGVPV